jgi:hypothetical protein
MSRLVALAVLLVAAGTASAEDVQGVYDVKYEQMSSNCSNALSFKAGELKIDVKQKSLVVNIETVPQMVGVADVAKGKINAVTKKVSPTLVEGMDGKFSVAGRVQNGVLQLVFVGEYSTKGKALCTQSWNITGAKR